MQVETDLYVYIHIDSIFSPVDWVWFEGLEGETPDAPASQDKEEETEMSPDLEVQFWGKTENAWKKHVKMEQIWSNSSSDRIIQFWLHEDN